MAWGSWAKLERFLDLFDWIAGSTIVTNRLDATRLEAIHCYYLSAGLIRVDVTILLIDHEPFDEGRFKHITLNTSWGLCHLL